MLHLSGVDLTAILGATVAIASALANVVPSHTIFGKVLHFIAFNFFEIARSNAEPKSGLLPK